MADKNNMTVFQRLNSLFNSDNVGTNRDTFKSYDPNAIVLKTNDKDEFESKKLEYQQTSYLKRLWSKVSSSVLNQKMANESRRLPSYIEYETMDEHPIIHRALDILAEEATVTNEKGQVINIHSDSPRVKKELENLFNNRLSLNVNLVSWCRTMCKNGDSFLYMDLDNTAGVLGVKQLPCHEVERHEGDLNDFLRNPTERQETIFKYRTSNLEFKNWQMSHFRLLSDDKKLPYGMSVLEGARRVWRNLIYTEDAMRTIRLLRATDRRVFYIDTGNIDPNDVGTYINDIADRFKRKKKVDPNTGMEDLKYNVMSIDQDYFIPVRGNTDGTKIDTLSGQSNTDIADIEYDRDMLAAALGIPKTYLNFAQAAGEGKSLSMQDVRFARTIVRIQQSLINELNKIAIVHLTLLGLEDELSNFQIGLNNPSIQADILRTEALQGKVNLYISLTDTSTGLAPMSKTRAKKEILGMSSDEIIFDAEQQRLERAIDAELKKTEQIIQRTGLFDKVDKLYGLQDAEYKNDSEGNPIDGGDSAGDFSGSGDSSFNSLDGENLGGDLNDDINDPTDADTNIDEPPTDDTQPTADNVEAPTEPAATPENLQQNSKIIRGEILIERINKLLKG